MDVDDVVQEVYIQLYESLRKYDSEKPFRPWLVGLRLNKFILIEERGGCDYEL